MLMWILLGLGFIALVTIVAAVNAAGKVKSGQETRKKQIDGIESDLAEMKEELRKHGISEDEES